MKTDKKDGEYGSKTPRNFAENTRKFNRTVKDIRSEINKNVEEFERRHFEEYGVYQNPFDGA